MANLTMKGHLQYNMRPRKKKHLNTRLEAVSDLLVRLDKTGKVTIKDIFSHADANTTFDLEIGCGKGSFAINYVKSHPDRQLLAVEKISDVIVSALEKAYSEQLINLRFMVADATWLCDALPEHTVEIIFINFCDPWLKTRYAKRRLTYRAMLEKYKKLLTQNGRIEFKTDNDDLFEFSIQEFVESGFSIDFITYDLHSEPIAEQNIITEYERNFIQKGFKIKKLICSMK